MNKLLGEIMTQFRFRSKWMFLFLLIQSSFSLAISTKMTDQVKEVKLDNGMTLLLVHKPGAPNIAGGWVAHVGSANEKPGITGISHLFEHMMFKGSKIIGTKDNHLDKSLRDQLDAIRTKMFLEERSVRAKVRSGFAKSLSDSSVESEHMKKLKKDFEALIKKQRSNMVKDEFDKIYTEAGASGMNAFTNEDMTVYFNQVPKNKLELWFWMESERLFEPVFREFYSERNVVYEERRMRTESTPTGKQNEVFNTLFWRGSTYAWPVVGWPSDISAITRQQAENYFSTYYAPNNITAAIVGDFDDDQAIKFAKKYFGRIPRGKITPPDVVTLRTAQLGELTFQASVDAPPSAEIAYNTTAFAGKDDPALSVLESVLNGRTGRLYKRLVLKDKIATNARASNDARKYDGMFTLSANGVSNVSPKKLRAALLDEIEKIKKNGVSEKELTKVKNNLSAAKFRRLKEPFNLLIQLLYTDGLRSWKVIDTYFDNIMKVKNEDLIRVTKKYFTKENRANKLFTRSKKQAPENPELKGFSDQQKMMANQILAMPATKLKQILPKLQEAMGKAPAKDQSFLKYLIKKVENKISGEKG